MSKKQQLTNINAHSDHLPVDSKKHSHIIESDLYQMVEKNYLGVLKIMMHILNERRKYILVLAINNMGILHIKYSLS